VIFFTPHPQGAKIISKKEVRQLMTDTDVRKLYNKGIRKQFTSQPWNFLGASFLVVGGAFLFTGEPIIGLGCIAFSLLPYSIFINQFNKGPKLIEQSVEMYNEKLIIITDKSITYTHENLIFPKQP